jgi:hypothetical protein
VKVHSLLSEMPLILAESHVGSDVDLHVQVDCSQSRVGTEDVRHLCSLSMCGGDERA